MIDPPRIANLLSAGQHNLNYFVRKRKIKCVIKCVCIQFGFNFLRMTNPIGSIKRVMKVGLDNYRTKSSTSKPRQLEKYMS